MDELPTLVRGLAEASIVDRVIGGRAEIGLQLRGSMDNTATTTTHRLLTYTNERFPLGTHVPAAALFFFAAFLTAKGTNGLPPLIGWEGLAGVATFLLVLFHLRVMDEFKDQVHDARYYPTRPVPRGVISLAELRRLGFAAVGVQIALNVAFGLPVLAAYAAVLGFSLLMLKEGFQGPRLRQNVLVYAVSHMPVVPLMAAYAYALAISPRSQFVQPSFGWFLALCFSLSLLLEVVRKVHVPNEEREGVDTYSKLLGTSGVAYVAGTLAVVTSLCASVLGQVMGFPMAYHVLVAVLGTGLLAVLATFAWRATEPRALLLGTLYVPAFAGGVYALMIAAVALRLAR